MLVIRNVFRAKYGMGDALAKLFVDEAEKWAGEQKFRVLTDASGPFFTIVLELTVDDFASYEAAQAEEFARPEFADWFAKMVPLVDSGYREFWTVQYG